MKLNKNYWLFRLTEFTYCKNLSPNGSVLGWKLIFLPILLVLTYPSLVLKRISYKEFDLNIFGSLLVGLLIQLFSLGLGHKVIPNSNIIFKLFIGLFTMIVCVGLIFGFIYCVARTVVYLEELEYCKKSKKIKKVKQPNFFKVWFKSVKEKSCPKIDWYDE